MISNGSMINSDIQGIFTFNSDKYSVNDLVSALLSQGIPIHKIGPNLKIGQKIINPVINHSFNYSSQSVDSVNENVIQGLASQIQRIFSELNKLKDHLGVNNGLMQELQTTENQLFSISSMNEKATSSKSFENKNKWESFIPSKNFDLQSKTNENTFIKEEPFEFRREKIDNSQTPIITLGKKRNPSLIDEYNDLVTNKGITDDDALDSLSSKLFNTANRSLFNGEKKQDLRAALNSPLLEDNVSQNQVTKSDSEFSPLSFSKCDNCNSKIPNEAVFCSKCVRKNTPH